MDWKKIFNNKYVLTFIQYYNLIILSIYTIGCYIYLFEKDSYKSIYDILVALFGFNLSSQVFVGYLLSKLKFCKWQLLAFLFNVIINILGVFFNIIHHTENDIIIMTILGTVFTVYTVVFMAVEVKKVGQKANIEKQKMSTP